MNPANQCFRRYRIAGCRFHNRLIVHLEFTVGNGRLIFAHNLHLIHIDPAHGIVKYRKWLHMVAEDTLFRQLRPVDHTGNILVVFVQAVYSAVAVELHASVFELSGDFQLCGHGFQVNMILLYKANKVVGIQPSGNLRIPEVIDPGIKIP